MKRPRQIEALDRAIESLEWARMGDFDDETDETWERDIVTLTRLRNELEAQG
jgi:hypothetical protein